MRSKLLYPLLAAEAAGCAALAVFLTHHLTAGATAFTALLSFPFAPIGNGLRALSLLGGAGNLAAWGIYLLVCLAPAALLAVQLRRKTAGKEGWLLALLSGLLFVTMYYCINPGLLSRWFLGPAGLATTRATCCTAVWLCLLAWAVLRLLGRLPDLHTLRLQTWLTGLLLALDVSLVAGVFGVQLYGLLDKLKTFAAANTALTTGARLPTQTFLVLHALVDAAPALLLVWVIHRAMDLLQTAKADPYSDETLAAAHRLAAACKGVVIFCVLGQLLFAVAQLAFAGVLYQIDSNLSLPVDVLAMTIAAMLWARWVAESKALKDENEGFI
ncbi:MAG: hypothetical protein IJ347_08655 [Faecalibacterium sp.]|nr:hypothetical protein [Faecalibacterium sp.]